MRRFGSHELEEALTYAADGGQALHCHKIVFASSPFRFRAAVKRGEEIGHLFDQDVFRLRATVKRLGVAIIFIEHPGTPRQHVDLCLGPMRRALALYQEGN